METNLAFLNVDIDKLVSKVAYLKEHYLRSNRQAVEGHRQDVSYFTGLGHWYLLQIQG